MIEKILALSRGTGKEENVILPRSAPKEVCALFLDHLDILIRNQKKVNRMANQRPGKKNR
jgi:hypothetical protein